MAGAQKPSHSSICGRDWACLPWVREVEEKTRQLPDTWGRLEERKQNDSVLCEGITVVGRGDVTESKILYIYYEIVP